MDMMTGEQFCFSPISDADYELYYQLLMDEPIIQWIHEEDMSEKMKKDILNTMMSFYWTPLKTEKETYSVFMRETKDFIGEICLYQNKYNRPEMGISILKKFRGRGNGQAIIKEWSMLIAENKGISQLDVHIEEGNVESQRCMERLGAQYIANDGDRYYHLDIPIFETR